MGFFTWIKVILFFIVVIMLIIFYNWLTTPEDSAEVPVGYNEVEALKDYFIPGQSMEEDNTMLMDGGVNTINIEELPDGQYRFTLKEKIKIKNIYKGLIHEGVPGKQWNYSSPVFRVVAQYPFFQEDTNIKRQKLYGLMKIEKPGKYTFASSGGNVKVVIDKRTVLENKGKELFTGYADIYPGYHDIEIFMEKTGKENPSIKIGFPGDILRDFPDILWHEEGILKEEEFKIEYKENEGEEFEKDVPEIDFKEMFDKEEKQGKPEKKDDLQDEFLKDSEV